MLIPKLAFRNLVGAGVRTWLNVAVLSIAFVAIIWTQGMIEGMNKQLMTAMIDTEYGGGQLWHQAYDRFDPLTIDDAHGVVSEPAMELVARGEATPILVTSAAIFPEGRMQSVQLRGIDPEQQIVNLPTHVLAASQPDTIPALIGKRMAEQTQLVAGDSVTVRWRDVHGMFDATDVQIAGIMDVTSPSVDNGQLWLPLEQLREMVQAPGEATYLILSKQVQAIPTSDPMWAHRGLDYLLADVIALVETKTVSSSIFYGLLLTMGLLAIFDTQVLAIFRRRKEIGTLMALGMPRGQVIRLFTFEGALHGLLALIVGAVYGIPLLIYSVQKGLPVGDTADQTGFAMSDTLYPTYGAGLVGGTTLLVLVTVTIVSMLPTRKIVKLRPTDALKGKMS